MVALREWMLREDGEPMQSRAVSSHDLLSGSSFALTGSTDAGRLATIWGQGLHGRFSGREGAVTLYGEVTTGFLGFDWTPAAGEDGWIAGLAIGRTTGTGGWDDGNDGQTKIAAELTGLYPYGGLPLSENLSAWMMAGYGTGTVAAKPNDGESRSADLNLAMGAVGLRGEVVRDNLNGGDLTLALTTDARMVRIASSRSPDGGMPATEATVWQLRTGIEGSRRFLVRNGDATFTPSLEMGMHWDGGDAEQGLGVEMGLGMAYSDFASGLGMDIQSRILLAHTDRDYREWGVSAGLAYDPDPTSNRGVVMSLRQSLGVHSVGGSDELLGAGTLAGLAAGDVGTGQTAVARQIEGEVGYGLPAFDGGLTGTPNFGFRTADGGEQGLRLGWRLTPAAPDDIGFELQLDATRHKSFGGLEPALHGVMLSISFNW